MGMYLLYKFNVCTDRWAEYGLKTFKEVQKYTRHDHPRLDGVPFGSSSGTWMVKKVC